MARQLTADRLLLATHNAGKLSELRRLLAPFALNVVSAGELGLPEPVEDGSTFNANARLKAQAGLKASGLTTLADDSGIEVRGLDNAPGIHSARWAGPDRDFSVAMRRVHDELAGRFGSFELADRRARFVAVLCLAWPDGEVSFVRGEVDGLLVYPPRGKGGFGYDPMFVPDGQTATFAEMPAADKQQLSHRARALRALVALHLGGSAPGA